MVLLHPDPLYAAIASVPQLLCRGLRAPSCPLSACQGSHTIFCGPFPPSRQPTDRLVGTGVSQGKGPPPAAPVLWCNSHSRASPGMKLQLDSSWGHILAELFPLTYLGPGSLPPESSPVNYAPPPWLRFCFWGT